MALQPSLPTYDSHDRLQTEVLSQDGTEVHTIEYDYDPNGNLISRTQTTAEGSTHATTYTWNDDDRLVKVETPTNVVEYEYDTEGIRVSSTVDGETTDYLIDKNQPYAQVLEEFRSGDLETFLTQYIENGRVSNIVWEGDFPLGQQCQR